MFVVAFAYHFFHVIGHGEVAFAAANGGEFVLLFLVGIPFVMSYPVTRMIPCWFTDKTPLKTKYVVIVRNFLVTQLHAVKVVRRGFKF